MGSRIEELLVTISIDTECDHDVNWTRSSPLTYDSISEGLPNRLQPAFMEVGAIPTYLLTIELLEHPPCVSVLRNLQGAHELGSHLHADFVEPEKKYHDYAGVHSYTFQSSYAPHIEYRKLANLTHRFTDAFGYAPTSFRAGRYGAGPATVDSLQKLGYLVDTSVTPYMRWREPCGEADFRRAPEQPYFPAADSIAVPGHYVPGRLLEVPVTVKPRLFRRTPSWFRPWFSSVEMMKEIVRYHLKTHRNQRVLNLNMMFHSMEVIEKASPYPQTPDDVQRFIDDMQEALAWCGREGARFVSLSDLHASYATTQTG